jgi:hypothetical protein
VDKLEHHIMIVPKRRPPKSGNDGNPAKFPSSRYFQIHFQHIEAQLEQTNRSLEALLQQVATLQSRLAQAGIDLDHPNNE